MASALDYTPVALKQAYAAKIPHSQLVVIPDAHHAVPVERPGLFNEALLTFLLASEDTKGDESG
jgi:3-oxoadipate enol-lactonase